MQGLVLQLTRVGFLLLLWLFIWSVLRILKTDIYAPTGAVMVRRGLALREDARRGQQRNRGSGRDSGDRTQEFHGYFPTFQVQRDCAPRRLSRG